MTSQSRRALFLLHNFNDIDHMGPVVDMLQRTGCWQCDLVFYPFATHGSVDFDRDWRLAHLRRTHNIRIRHAEAVDPLHGLSLFLHRVREWLTGLCDRTPPIGRLGGRDLRGLLPWFLVWRAYDHLLVAWLSHGSGLGRRLLGEVRPDIVVVDWGLTHLLVHPALRLARRRGIPILELPHGAWTYEGIYSHPSQLVPGKLDKKTRFPLTESTVMAIDNVYKGYRSLVQGVPEGRLRLLGLPRFTPGWLSALANMPHAQTDFPGSGKPRLVWFTTWLMACRVEEVDRTLQVLEAFSDRLDIVLKVHTRNPGHEVADYSARLRKDTRIRVVANEVESFAMTRWADYVMITQSSIVYDAFVLGKPVLYLKYTHEFECTWEVDRVGETLRDVDALQALLARIAEGRYQPSYTHEDVERYLSLMVYGGLAADAVLPAYRTLFEQCAAHEPVSVGDTLAQGVARWEDAGRQRVRTEPPSVLVDASKDAVTDSAQAVDGMSTREQPTHGRTRA